MAEDSQPNTAGGLIPPKLQVDIKPIAREAMALASSHDRFKQKTLRTQLTDEKYLLRLNTADEYLRLPPESLQLQFIFDALLQNPDPFGLATLDALAASDLYKEPGSRQILLLASSGKINSAPANIRSLWQRELHPDAVELDLTIASLINNGGETAIALWQNALLTNDYEQDIVVAWLQESVLTHRQDPILLQACKRLLLSSTWPLELKHVLLEVLFDYRPEHWYSTLENPPPRPPDRDALSDVARQHLLDLASQARTLNLLDDKRLDAINAELSVK